MVPEDQDRIASEQDNAEERYCHQMLAELRRSYEKAAAPYINRLVVLAGLRTPVRTVTMDQAQMLEAFNTLPDDYEVN
jgi:hypothetical protein